MKYQIIKNKYLPKFKPIKEIQSLEIPNINKYLNIPFLNGFRYVITGPPGSGKSNMLLNLFKTKDFYKDKFDNIFVFMPISSIESVNKHPFKNLPFLFEDLKAETIYNIIQLLRNKKLDAVEYMEKMKNKRKKPIITERKKRVISLFEDYQEEEEEEEEPKKIEYSVIILDDIADKLKDKEIVKALKTLLIQSRHIMCAVVITLQNYFLMDKSLRKLINYISIFEPPNLSEWNSYNEELIGINTVDGKKLKDFVFDEKYNHLDIDITNKKMFVNFHPLNIQE